VSVRFDYDAMNRRAARQDGSTWVEFVHDPAGHLLAEVTRPATQTGTWSTRREYAWLDGQPLAQLEYPGPTTRTDGWTYWFHLDHLGTPRALTSEAGATVWTATPVRPYGDVVEAKVPDALNGRTVVTNLRLPGQYDERLLTGIGIQGPYYNWNRWYLPSVGRYMELDSIALAGGFNGFVGPNWYGYAEGNPLRWTDRWGQTVRVSADARVRIAVDWARQSPTIDAMYRELDASELLVTIDSGSLARFGALGMTSTGRGSPSGCGRPPDTAKIRLDLDAIAAMADRPTTFRFYGGDVVAHELSHAFDFLIGINELTNDEARARAFADQQRADVGLPPMSPGAYR
jgi:RHS repeat-associated protein